MHSHIWFHHVSPCPAVSPRRWAGHHPVRHPVQGSQTASEWLIINPGSLRPPNKNLNRPPKKKTAIKTEWSLWTARQVHHQTKLEPTFGPFGIQEKGPAWPQHFFAETGSPSGVAFASALTFWTGLCSPWKMLGIVMTHDLGDPIIYDQPVPSDNTGFWTLLASFCWSFFWRKMCVSGQYPQYPHAWITFFVFWK